MSALTCAAIAAASSAAVASATTPRLARQNVRNASTKTLQIDAVIADGADPFYLTMRCGAEAAAKTSDVDLTWQGSTSVDVAPEVATLNAVELRHPQAIILAPFDPNVFIAPVKALMAKGVPVVTVDGDLNKKVELENVRTDNTAAGALAADQLGAKLHGTGTVGVISFNPSTPVEVQRVEGFANEMKKKYPKVTILPTQYGGADAGKSATITSGLLESHPNLSALYVTDANDAEGAASSVRAAGDLGKVPVVAYDATPVEVQDLKAGLFTALIAQEPYQEGYRAVTVLAQYLRKQVTRAQIPYYYPTGAAVITKANVNLPATRSILYTSTCS